MAVSLHSTRIRDISAHELNAQIATPAHTDVDTLVTRAQEEERAGRRDTARALYEQALRCVRSSDDAARASNVLRWIARTHHVDGNADAARDCLDAALALAELWNDDAAAGHAINVQAVVCWQRGELDDAERLYLLARSRAFRAGDVKLAAMTAQNLGVLANIRGDFEVAEQHYMASLAEYRSFGLTTDVCIALNNIGLLYIAQQRWEQAERVLLEGVQICELSGDLMTRTQLDINLAELWVRRGEFARAQSAVRMALDAAAQTGDASAIGKATKLLGVIARETGAFEEADRYFRRSDEVATARGELLLQAEVARERADLARRMGKNREVLQQLNRSHRLFTILRAQPDLTDVGQRVADLEQEFLHVARRWGESIEAKDRYTQGHCQRVADMACAIARKSGLDEHQLFWFRIGALLHDVGKLVIPEQLLNKPGKLDDAEWQLMRSHTTAGVEMLADIEFPWDVRPLVESHHERWDGKGYPHGLAGEDIPLIARILTIADVYDALTSVRSYKRAHSHDDTMTILRKDVGTMFDPRVFAWFEDIAVDWPTQAADPVQDHAPVANATSPVLVASGVDTAGARASTVDDETLDDLTRMPTRRAFRETAGQMLDARRISGRPVSLLVIDVDHFKVVNDTFGHMQGDAVIRLVSTYIASAIRTEDYAARYAGDEFVVLLPGTRLEDACVVAERIRDAVMTAVFPRLDGAADGLSITLSIGAACAPLHGDELEALFGAADSALYGAKRGGRNAVTSAARIASGTREVLLDTFVGRDTERTRLRKLLGNAAVGEPHVALLFGEAGVGKSALLKQLGPDVAICAGAVLHGPCIEADVGIPYGPWADIVRSADRAGLVPSRSWRELSRLVPDLSGARERHSEHVVSLDAPSGGSQRVLLEELEEFLRLASVTRPVVVVLDDMQWADSATWDALEFLVARFRDQRLLMCLTVRPEDMSELSASRLRRLSRSERCSDSSLQRLDRHELQQWLRTALGGQAPCVDLLDHIMQQSEGNPFFVVQTVRALVEDGGLRTIGDEWTFVPRHDAEVPRAIGDLLARRVQRLTPERRDILALAAVLGRDFDPEALVAAYDGAESKVHDALDEGIATAVLESSSRTRPTLRFTHALLTRALLRGANPLRLRSLHDRAARALERLPVRDLAAIAAHFDMAGNDHDAYRTAIAAGAQAKSVYAYESAADFFKMARRHALQPSDVVSAEWQLAQVEELGGRMIIAESHCDAALAASAETLANLGIGAAVRRMRERIRLHRGVAAEEVVVACTALLESARLNEDRDETVSLLVMLSTLHQRLGDLYTAEQSAREAVGSAESLVRQSLHADAVMRLGSVLLSSSPANAIPHYRRSLDLYTRLGDRHGQLRCQINIGAACDRAGNHPGAEASYVAALELGREVRATDFIGIASLNLGVLMLKTGQYDAARDRFNDALTLFTTTGQEPHRLASMYNLAHVARAMGDSAGALTRYGACAVLAGVISQRDVHVGALAGAGLCELDLQRDARAAAQLDRARCCLDEGDQRWFQGRELFEALRIRLAAWQDDATPLALLLDALERAEQHDQYAALWLGAECVPCLHVDDPSASATRERLARQARSLGYVPLVTLLSAV